MSDKSDTDKADLEKLKALVEAKECLGCSHEGVVITSAEGNILETTPNGERILEIPLLELKGKNIREFCPTPDVYESMLDQASRHLAALNRSIVLAVGLGKKKLVNMSIQRTGEGPDARYVHVFQDCADLRTMEDRLLQAERLATVGKFASQIAHEIRNPLNSISLNVELLEDELQDNEEGRGLIRSILHELDRLNDIVGEYLQFARFPKPHLQRGRIDGVIKEVAAAFKARHNIKLEIHTSDRTPEVWLDGGLLRQVIDNLIRNAAEAIVGAGSIFLETDLMERFLVIRVRDTGSGFSPDIQAKLFEPFFTTKTQGTGLGLATSQQIIFEHNGHLLAESQPGKGSTFSILLPL